MISARKMATPSAEVVDSSTGEDWPALSRITSAPATAADCGSTTLILRSAAEAAATRNRTGRRTRDICKAILLFTRKGLLLAVRAGLLASRVGSFLRARRP